MTTYGNNIEDIMELFLHGMLSRSQMQYCVSKIHKRENDKLIMAMKKHGIDQYK